MQTLNTQARVHRLEGLSKTTPLLSPWETRLSILCVYMVLSWFLFSLKVEKTGLMTLMSCRKRTKTDVIEGLQFFLPPILTSSVFPFLPLLGYLPCPWTLINLKKNLQDLLKQLRIIFWQLSEQRCTDDPKRESGKLEQNSKSRALFQLGVLWVLLSLRGAKLPEPNCTDTSPLLHSLLQNLGPALTRSYPPQVPSNKHELSKAFIPTTSTIFFSHFETETSQILVTLISLLRNPHSLLRARWMPAV